MKGVSVVRENVIARSPSISLFCPLTEKFEVTDAAIRKNPEFIPDISLIWSGTPTCSSWLRSI